MAGIYIHIPFCKQACNYCNFHFSTQIKNRQPLLDALKSELLQRKGYVEGENINTIYFGGGTPSLLDASELSAILALICNNFNVHSDAEITLEANPDDIRHQQLLDLKRLGVNRLSIGIQSFHDADLQFMNRAHNAHEAINCVKLAQDIGLDNISIDLIYGTPNMDEIAWLENLNIAISLSVNHISAYCLTVEPKTALNKMVQNGKVPAVNEMVALQHFEILMQQTADYGFEHYEISNFAKGGHYAQHNTNYWLGEKYLGLGPSAHSFNGVSRQWNFANNNQYIKAINEKTNYFEEETLSLANQYNEYLMTGLRTMWGIDLKLVEKRFGKPLLNQLLLNATTYLATGQLVRYDDKITISSSAKFVADGIISDLFEIA